MKNLNIILLALLLCNTLLGQNKKDKKTADAQAYLNLKELITEGTFVFSADWATTQQGDRINLI
ncbi:MAG: hypothetical protein U5K51_05675 [Flavobacteriaceae bacterium]|nr:hypothetical protein [Flavobacteriaceae bacterium]